MIVERIHSSRLVIGLVFLALGCGPSGSPRATLQKFLQAEYDGDYETAYSCLSSSDQGVRSVEEYKDGLDDAVLQAIREKSSFEVVDVTTQDDSASATVSVTLPDPTALMGDMIGSAFSAAFSGASDKDMKEALAEKIRTAEDLPQQTTTEEYALVLEESGWRVFHNWAREDKVALLMVEANLLKKQKKLYAALEKYDQVLELDSTLVEAETARAETQTAISGFEEKQQYIDNVVLYDLKARYYDTYLDKRMPGVEFKLKNNGDRTLNRVEVTVYFKDSSGAVIAEEDFLPVIVSNSSFSLRDNKPLKPNYIWQLERDKFYKAESVPSEWKAGSVSAKITDIEFGD